MGMNILVFGDSNTWGWDPGNTLDNIRRLPDNVRWPAVMQTELGPKHRVIDEGLNGRTTVWDDPIEEYRCGKEHLIPLLDSHAPLDLAIIFLGTNDLKYRFGLTAEDVSFGAGLLVQKTLQRPGAFVDMEPIVLLVAPPLTGPLEGSIFEEMFRGSVEKSQEFGRLFKAQADAYGIEFFDAGQIVNSSPKDGIHLEPESHKALGMALAEKVRSIL